MKKPKKLVKITKYNQIMLQLVSLTTNAVGLPRRFLSSKTKSCLHILSNFLPNTFANCSALFISKPVII